ncbi:MAG TPA: twin-arginine translocase TatA/TatE family subunit [Methylomirabilota bacterium]|nr:twin-arginine translocase TatA/TatE family subunit [Methylomirabilota bacterium]
MLGGWEIVLILAVVLILFGAKKLPELAKGLGQGIKEFKKATTDVQSEISRAMEDDSYRQPYRPESPEQKRLSEPTQPARPAAEAQPAERKS